METYTSDRVPESGRSLEQDCVCSARESGRTTRDNRQLLAYTADILASFNIILLQRSFIALKLFPNFFFILSCNSILSNWLSLDLVKSSARASQGHVQVSSHASRDK